MTRTARERFVMANVNKRVPENVPGDFSTNTGCSRSARNTGPRVVSVRRPACFMRSTASPLSLWWIQLEYFITRSIERLGGDPAEMPIETVRASTGVRRAAQEQPLVAVILKMLHDQDEKAAPKDRVGSIGENSMAAKGCAIRAP